MKDYTPIIGLIVCALCAFTAIVNFDIVYDYRYQYGSVLIAAVAFADIMLRKRTDP